MKLKFALKILALALLACAGCLPGFAQGTAFVYQGQLDANGAPANGNYDISFTIYDSLTPSGNMIAGPITNTPTAVSNGLFQATIDFGPGVFNGNAYWIELGVRTNGIAATFTTLSPRQPLLPVPYAIMAGAASNLLGLLPTTQLTGTVPVDQLSGAVANAQLANSSITITAGPGLSGGGVVALGGSIALANPGVLSINGDSDITASTVNGAVTLVSDANSANVDSTLVKRDNNGNFSAGTITLSGTLAMANSGANTGVGQQALAVNTSGDLNTANGAFALYSNTSGDENTANGAFALRSNTNGNLNTANGAYALYSNTSGGQNTANGAFALYSNTNGSQNTANGAGALTFNSSGNENTANGIDALYYNTDGDNNTANGAGALTFNSSGNENTANGIDALYYNTDGDNNTAYGAGALYLNTIGTGNIALGNQAGADLTTGNNNIEIGNLGLAADDSIIRIGTPGLQANTYVAGVIYGNGGGLTNLNVSAAALPASPTFSGTVTANAFTGNGGGLTNIIAATASGSGNAAIGASALNANTSGSGNTAIGSSALLSNTKGSGNTANGSQALGNNTTGGFNTADGYSALGSLGAVNNAGGSNNIALGNEAGFNFQNNESSNIDIGNPGTPGDNNIIRIGTPGVQTSNFIAGVYGVSPAGAVPVMVNSAGQLGTVGTVPSADLSGTYGNAVTLNNAANSFTGSGAGLTGIIGAGIVSGQVVKSVNGLEDAVVLAAGANVTITPSGNTLTIASSGGSSGWSLAGNSGANPANGNFLGTTDTNALELHVNDIRALRLEPGAGGRGSPNVIGGTMSNFVAAGVFGATIAGGGATNYGGDAGQLLVNKISGDFGSIGGGSGNNVQGNWGTIGGGLSNNCGNTYATVAGGLDNSAGELSFIGGGAENTANGEWSTIAGGYLNSTGAAEGATVGGGEVNINNGSSSTIAGGYENVIAINANDSVIGGGNGHTITGSYATIPGGFNNIATNYAFAAGTYADATNVGAFVWSDSYTAHFYSINSNEFAARSLGGVRFVTGVTAGGNPVPNAGVYLAPGASSWTAIGSGAAAAVTNTEINVTLSGTFNGNGGGLTNLNISGLEVTSVGNGNPVFGPIKRVSTQNFFIGPTAGNAATTGSYNTGEGWGALSALTSGGVNTAMGEAALSANTSGTANTAVGGQALWFNTIGNDNTAIGVNAISGGNATTSPFVGSNNIALGFDAGSSFMGSESSNIDIGNVGSTGENNIIRIGSNQTVAYIAGILNGNGGGLTNLNISGLEVTSVGNGNPFLFGPIKGVSKQNFFIGPTAGNAATTGSYNTGEGWGALSALTSGGVNTAMGEAALSANTSGTANTAVGGQALWFNTIGNDNTAIGVNAISGGNATTSPFVGSNNIALGFDAGSSFMGSESSNIDIGNVGSTGENNIIRIGTDGVQTATYLTGTVYANGVALTSDRNAKENFKPVDNQTVLAKVAALPVTEWNYKTDSQHVQHIGPMAQDFRAAFGLAGADDIHISVVDEGGVALAAIQGLNAKLKEKDGEIQALQQQVAALQTEQARTRAKWDARFDALQKAVAHITRDPAEPLAVNDGSTADH